MKSAVDYMKKNPGKAIPRALGKMGKATFTGDSFKKGLISGGRCIAYEYGNRWL